MAGVHAGLIPLREERVLEDPRRPGGLPHDSICVFFNSF